MANLINLKRRIQAAKNVSKTTKAMQMIAASKMKRAQDATLSTRPYVKKLGEMTRNVTAQLSGKFTHPYLTVNTESDRTLLIAISPDKGLCGGLITNLLREFFLFSHHNQKTTYIGIGKKIEAKVGLANRDVLATFHFGTTLPSFDMVYPLMRLIDEQYSSKKVREVKILTTEFTNVFTQTPKVTTLLPFSLPNENTQPENNDFYLFEPHAKNMLPSLLTHYVEMTLYQQLLESFVSEQAARMMAMQNATDNANDIIATLQLDYNKTRQAKITSEILDITGASIAISA